jgi:hypothetical protein
MKPELQIEHNGPNQFPPVCQKNLSCPGYILRSNKQGLVWKQVCSCCPRPPAHRYLQSELRPTA